MAIPLNKFCTSAPGSDVAFIVVSFSRQQAVHQADAIYTAVCDAIEHSKAAYGFQRIRITLMAPPGPVPFWRVLWEARAKLQQLRTAFKGTQLAFEVVTTDPTGLSITDRGVAQCLCIALGVSWGGVSAGN